MTRIRSITNKRTRGFTLIELLITISIIGLMASMVLFATYSAMEQAKVQKTRALIAKLDAIIKAKWDAYKTRRLPVDFGADIYDDLNGNGQYDGSDSLLVDRNGDTLYTARPSAAALAKMRLDVLHDLMRMELPDRWTDVDDQPIAPFGPAPFGNYASNFKVRRSAVSQAYLRRLKAVVGNASPPYPANIYENQGAECLYMIVMAALTEEGDAREVFKPGDIGDTDPSGPDGLPEFLDAWGRPIKFIRWAPGFTSELQVLASGVVADYDNSNPQNVKILVNVATTGGAVNYPAFSMVNGSYVGGAIAGPLDKSFGPANASYFRNDEQMAGDAIGRITAYTYDPSTGQAIFTCSAPSPNKAFEYNGVQKPPQPGQQIFVMAPDPFDPSGVYPNFANLPTSIPSFGTYPLIYSAGPDKQYGVISDTSPQYHYTAMIPLANSIYPMALDLNNKNELFGSFPLNPLADESEGPVWRDNIHNHLQATK